MCGETESFSFYWFSNRTEQKEKNYNLMKEEGIFLCGSKSLLWYGYRIYFSSRQKAFCVATRSVSFPTKRFQSRSSFLPSHFEWTKRTDNNYVNAVSLHSFFSKECFHRVCVISPVTRDCLFNTRELRTQKHRWLLVDDTTEQSYRLSISLWFFLNIKLLHLAISVYIQNKSA